MSTIEHFHATETSPSAAPLSPAVRAGDFVFVSGQVPVEGGEIITGGSIIIPIDMRIEATTMSMMTNGK